MAFVKVEVIFLFIVYNSCVNGNSLEHPPDIHKKMIEPLVTCHLDHLKVVITTPYFSQLFLEESCGSSLISTIVLDENFKLNAVRASTPQLATYVFPSGSTASLETMLQTVKSSPWWHIDAFLFMIENSQDECKPAVEMLEHGWKMNLLSTFYLCYDKEDSMIIYTYNPYTNRALPPWVESKNFTAPDDRWTLYHRKYIEGSENCENINFDKTKFLDGYEIKGVASVKVGATYDENKIYNFKSLVEKLQLVGVVKLYKEVFTAMNATVTVTYASPGFFWNGKPMGFVLKLLDGSRDIALTFRYYGQNVSSTRPFVLIGVRILTQQRNFLSPEEKIWHFYSVEIWYLTVIVLLITFVFILVIYKKRLFTSAAFDVLRLLLNTGLNVPLDNTSSRIFFFCVFQLFIILNATFQGNIAAFLTKPERIYIDSKDDLRKYDYDLYVPDVYQGSFDINRFPHFKFVHGEGCAEYVKNDSSAACVQALTTSIDTVIKHNLHVSKSTYYGNYGTFWCRDDWPLNNKFSRYSSRSLETGLLQRMLAYTTDIPLEKQYSREEKDTAARYRPIKFADLAFAFRLLAVGLGISILVFIVEIIPRRKCYRIMKVKTKCSMTLIIRKLKRSRQSD